MNITASQIRQDLNNFGGFGQQGYGYSVSALKEEIARILGLEGGTLKPGAPADVTLADLNAEYTICAQDFASKGKNTPFDGWKVTGRAVATLVNGRIAYRFDG